MQAKLHVINGKVSKTVIDLKPPLTIGRGKEAGLTVAHPEISRKHCQIYEQGGLLMIKDLLSTNGTLIGGRSVLEAPLPPDTEFSIGPLTFRVVYQYQGDLSKLPATIYAMPPGGTTVTTSPEPQPPARRVHDEDVPDFFLLDDTNGDEPTT